MQRLRILPALTLIALSASLLVAAGREMAATPGDTLTFDLRTGGDIEVTGWNRDTAVITPEITGRDADRITVDIAPTSSGIKVATRSSGHNVSASVKFKAQVPRNYSVDIRTMGGDVQLDQLEGDFEGETMGGDIVLKELVGEVDLKTMGGDVSVRDSRLDGNVHTMGGDVHLDTVQGNLDASTMGGDVIQRNVRAHEGRAVKVRSHGGDVAVDTAPAGADVHTMGGDITVQSADQFLKAKTMGGDIVVRRATGEADLHTMGGDIEVDSFDGEMRAVTMGGDVEVHVDSSSAGSGHDIDIESMGGDLTLHLPRNFSARFEIEVIKLKKRPDDAGITTDLAIQVNEPATWTPRGTRTNGHKYGSDYKVLTGTGSVNGGQHLVRLKTINGMVRIKTN